jgi:hypothetical protein
MVQNTSLKKKSTKVATIKREDIESSKIGALLIKHNISMSAFLLFCLNKQNYGKNVISEIQKFASSRSSRYVICEEGSSLLEQLENLPEASQKVIRGRLTKKFMKAA